MEEKILNNSKLASRMMVIVFGLILFFVLSMIALSFIKPKNSENIQSRIYSRNIDELWNIVYDRSIYLDSRKDLMKYHIIDTLMPRWIEYYAISDSVENRTLALKPRHYFDYLIVNRKYEQVNRIKIYIDSIDDKKTKVTIKERSIFLNNWASIYLKILKPESVLNFEFLKLNNSLAYQDSLAHFKSNSHE